MDTKILNKIIDDIVIPEFPLIEKISWDKKIFGHYNLYYCNIYFDRKNYSQMFQKTSTGKIKLESILVDVKGKIQTLFKMMGSDEDDRLIILWKWQ